MPPLYPSFSEAFGTRTANTARSRSLAATRLWPSLVLRKLLRQCRFWKMSRREIQISQKLVQSRHILGVSCVSLSGCMASCHSQKTICSLFGKGSLRFINLSPKIHCCCSCCEDRHTTKTCPSSNNHGSVENGKQTIVLVWDPFSTSINQEKSLCVCVSSTQSIISPGVFRALILRHHQKLLLTFFESETLQQLHVPDEDAHVALAVSYWASRDYSRAEDEWRVACENTDAGCRHQGVNKTAVFPFILCGHIK